MDKKIILFFKKGGMFSGKILKVFPLTMKKMITAILMRLIIVFPGKVGSLMYLCFNEIIKYMYFPLRQSIFLYKKISLGVLMRLDVSRKTQRILYLQKLYEPAISNYLMKNLHQGEVFVDVGANVGFFTNLGAELVGTRGSVIAFEPEKQNFINLIYNVNLNQFKNVICVNEAIGSGAGKSKLHINPLNEGGGSLRKFDQYSDDDERWSLEKLKKYFPKIQLEQETKIISLDEYLIDRPVKNNVVHLVKIDVEGAEFDVLSGMQKLLDSQRAPKIICEINQDQDAIFNILNKYKYRIYALDEGGNPYSSKILKGKNFLFSKQ